ncbi:hypothetical protein [Bathymodiolus platifrons methanotrophic gill symbiont]|uniref:hypothetical protein n=1 Tax=Bathymodiolus platifrons methanotrophic gill symbiont TaxID=113268 RepID=UPI001C8E6520|nr:hypothetical protein [Bathymodiolus platifrons methanotrophic gill symbiont]
MPFILSPPTLALRFRQNNGPTPSGDYQPSRSLSMAGSVCSHGNSYCSGKCSAQSRQEKQREACDRYQSSSKGRHLHALRQRHYRQRKKEKVTHQGSPGLVPYDLLTEVSQ